MFRIQSLIREDKEFSESVEAICESFAGDKNLPVVVNGLAEGARDAYLCEAVTDIRNRLGAPQLVLTEDEETAFRMEALLRSVGIESLVFKERDLVFHNITASHEVERERLSVLYSLLNGECDVVISTAKAACSYTMPTDVLRERSLRLLPGDLISPDELCKRLVLLGFASVDGIEDRGQFSRRGGIVDFWTGDSENPVRCEFFGDEVDRLSYFDSATQRSVAECDGVRIIPSVEVLMSKDAIDRVSAYMNKLIEGKNISDLGKEKLLREKNALDASLTLYSRDRYISLIYEKCECLMDYLRLKGKGVIYLIGTNGCLERLTGWLKNLETEAEGFISCGMLTKKQAVYSKSAEEYKNILNDNICVHLNPFAGGVGNIKLAGLFGFRTRRTVGYGDNMSMLLEDLILLRKGLYRIIILARTEQEMAGICQSLEQTDIAAIPMREDDKLDPSSIKGGSIRITVSSSEGFELINPKIAVLSLSKDSGRAVMSHRKRQRIAKKIGSGGQRLMSHADLSVGDYVVHANYGIGLFEGIETVTAMGVTKDYITIRYAGTDKLFVPCDKLDMIGKYIGQRDSDGTVKLSKMGGGEWTKTKNRAKSSAKDIAKELIALYAARQRRPGFAFPKSSELEEEFDSAFGFEETESQLTAIEEIKADMMRPVPMNRLLCGDVGFGKTEVALRAAFKAILGGKQVAILVPTTILALQHYQTAISRMRGYAVSVEMISRFKSARERKEIIEKTKRGSVDILIGTHALLSKNIEFKDLGLLIIDEEQRFGVSQKEKLREMATDVDTLMLSATPIPRTLNMAMSGINDISVLDEAPGERRPVQTYVLEHDDIIIFDAIRKELSRGGQTLYIYNKVEDIHVVASKIATEIPEARVAYAHGKQDKEEIEDIWHCLVRGEIDVLVCTTIVETGVDLPNANTLIIENSDRFGLSQLHQIRGRVGRSERQAYAYFTFRAGKALSEVAEKRLSAIREFAQFGAGFNIALRDLEIRGAGNLLGAEQHGYIESVGYDLYVKLLNEAILEEKGAEEKKFESTVVMNVSAYIPESYIKTSAGRMQMYKKISLIESAEDADDVLDELIDRYSDPPKPVQRLVNVALIKALASEGMIRKVEATRDRITFVLDKPKLEIWAELFAKFTSLSFIGAGCPNIVYRMKGNDDPAETAVRILREYSLVAKEENKE